MFFLLYIHTGTIVYNNVMMLLLSQNIRGTYILCINLNQPKPEILVPLKTLTKFNNLLKLALTRGSKNHFVETCEWSRCIEFNFQRLLKQRILVFKQNTLKSVLGVFQNMLNFVTCTIQKS